MSFFAAAFPSAFSPARMWRGRPFCPAIAPYDERLDELASDVAVAGAPLMQARASDLWTDQAFVTILSLRRDRFGGRTAGASAELISAVGAAVAKASAFPPPPFAADGTSVVFGALRILRTGFSGGAPVEALVA
jgi:hypothetical protein